MKEVTAKEYRTRQPQSKKNKTNAKSLAQVHRPRNAHQMGSLYNSFHHIQPSTHQNKMSTSFSCYNEGMKRKKSLKSNLQNSKKCIPVKHFKKMKDLDRKYDENVKIYSSQERPTIGGRL